MKRLLTCAGAALSLLVTAPGVHAQPRPPLSGPRAGMSASDFITAAAQTDEYERRAGRLAQKMGRSREVRDFGAMMVRDHTRTTNDLRAAIRRAGRTPPPSPPLRPDQQQMLDQLQRSGPHFDATYLDQMVMTHQEALGVMQGYATTGDVPALRNAARNTAPIVQRHLDRARRLQATVRPGAR